MKKQLLLFVTFLLPLVASAYDAKIDGIYYNFDTEKKTATVTYKMYYSSIPKFENDYSGEITIPSEVTYDNVIYSVTSIGNNAFWDSSGLLSVSIPNSVTSIGSNAFRHCGSLSSITIPNSVTSIGNDAFWGSGWYNAHSNGILYLDHWLLGYKGNKPNGAITIENETKGLADRAFNNCYGLTSIAIPNSVTSIGNRAFEYCSSLTSIGDLSACTFIGESAFYGCSSITSIGDLSACTSIGESAFYGCSSITSIGDLSACTSIGESAFYGCSSLTSVTIPNNATNIGEKAFSECSNLTLVALNSVECLSQNREYYKSLKTIFGEQVTTYVIGESITHIGDNTFSGCKKLQNVIIPNTLKSIGNRSFYDCSRLTKVTINDIAAWCNIDFSGSESNPLYYAHHLYSDGNTEIKDLVIPEGVTSINDYAFIGWSALASITIPNKVIDIGNSAFAGCSNLTLVTLDSSELLSQDREYNKSLETIFGEQVTTYVLGESITHIGKNTFYNCSKIQGINIPSSVESIGYNAFSNCSGLTKVTVNEIAAWCNIAFNGSESNPLYYAHHLYSDENTEITDLVIPYGITSISSNAFSGWSALSSVTIPNSVTAIGNSAFAGCSGLTSVTIPNNVNAIGTYAFSGCTGLTFVNIPNSVTSIENYVFYNCSALTSIEIPNSVTKIGESAFSGCSNLSSITIPNSVEHFGYDAFRYCFNLASVTIGDNVSYIGNKVFENNSKLYVNNHTITLLSLWNAGYKPYIIGTETILEPPYLTAETTQTTATLKINNYYEGVTYIYNNQPITGDEITITGFYPETTNTVSIGMTIGDGNYYFNILKLGVSTQPISPTVEIKTTASSIRATAHYIEGDAEVISQRFVLDPTSVTSYISGGTDLEGLTYVETGLPPGGFYGRYFAYEITVSNGKKNKKYLTQKTGGYTKSLTLTTQQPKVVSLGNVIVAAESNLDDEETNVGFEWRRTDWSDDFNSNTGGAYLYEGMMEGYIRNLYTEKLWKYRPYYTSNSGKTYYGDWVGIDPTNTSYFEPTVHTYANVDVSEGTATLNGYVMVGTDNITEQGFEYWIAAESNSPSSRAQQDVQTITATGTRMSATLTGLQNNATYVFRAFAKTTSGTTYGEERSFKTPSVTGIELVSTPSICSTVFNVYSLSGAMVRHKTTSFEGLPRGLYIVNGKKVVIK